VVPKPVASAPNRPQVPAGLRDVSGGLLVDELEWREVSVRGDFSAQAASGVEVAESRLTGTRMVAIDLERVRISDAQFEDCDLSGAVFADAVLTRVEFLRCRMSGLGLAGARLRDVRFEECKLDEANLRMTTGERIEFAASILRDSEFYAAKLPSARFFDCDLTAAQFSKADLRGARFHGSRVGDVLGAESFAGAVVETSQVLPLALGVYAALGITIDDDRET
jgi:uncharacterized protein YjbI with pentapeptide repeats